MDHCVVGQRLRSRSTATVSLRSKELGSNDHAVVQECSQSLGAATSAEKHTSMNHRIAPIVVGGLALVVTLSIIRWVWVASFTSLFGLILASVLAHSIGTAIALLFDLPPTKRATSLVGRRICVVTVCAVLLWVAVPIILRTLIASSARLFYSNIGAVISSVLVYCLCVALTSRIEPMWRHYAGWLGLVLFAAVGLYQMTISILLK